MNESKIKKSLSFSEKEINLIISKPKNYKLVSTHIIKNLTKSGKKGIYVTLNKNYDDIVANFTKQGIDLTKLFFIDATKSSKKRDNCIPVPSPEALTELSITIITMINTEKFDFLFFDSLNSVLAYNDFEVTKRFSHYIISKVKSKKITAIILSNEEKFTKNSFSVLCQSYDKCIDTRK